MKILNYLEDFIKNFYMHLGINNPIQLKMEDISRKLNIGLFNWNEPSQALFLNGHPYIFLNCHSPHNFQWQDFCHELGHILWHAGDQMRLPTSFVEYQEFKANNFSLHAAVPTFMLNELDLPEVYDEAVTLIQKKFRVSASFAARRLNHYVNNHIHTSQY
ncbi:ImmA/IrrE family metallo-endopeptidase [Rummeliibacillus sp. BSL5]